MRPMFSIPGMHTVVSDFQRTAEKAIAAARSGDLSAAVNAIHGFDNVGRILCKDYVELLARLENANDISEDIKNPVLDALFSHIKSRDRSKDDVSDDDSLVKDIDLIYRIFRSALEKKYSGVALLVLKQDPEKQLIPPGTHDYKGGTTLHMAVEFSSTEVLTFLLDSIDDERPLEMVTQENRARKTLLNIAIENGDLETVKVLCSRFPDLLNRNFRIAADQATLGNPLHIAVYHACDKVLKIVDYIVRSKEELLYSPDSEGKPPFAYAKDSLTKKDDNFLNALKQHVMRIPHLPYIRQALFGKGERHTELGLNFSDFNSSTHDFSRFVIDLSTYATTTGTFTFEDTLAHVILPDFHKSSDEGHHHIIASLFDWLHGKNVKRIIRLVIPDSLTHPMSNEFFQLIVLNKFKVTDLDWRKIDMDIDILEPDRSASDDSQETLERIQLYSSGNWGPLYHWGSEEGLQKRGKLEKINILIVKPKNVKPSALGLARRHNKSQSDRLVDYKARLGTMLEARGYRREKFTIVISDVMLFTYALVVSDPGLDIQDVVSREFNLFHDKINACKKNTQNNCVDANRIKDYPVKIAIVDSGADRVRSNALNIVNGTSYVYSTDGIELPWWSVRDPHGQHMASIISHVNPDCKLYIARVATQHNNVDATKAALAVQWAIEQGVDIISISWTTSKLNEDLKKAIEKATTIHNILVICTTADQGTRAGEVYPAHFDSCISVSACDSLGNKAAASHSKVDVLVLGTDVPVQGPSYIKTDFEQDMRGLVVSGSSVATAVTAGIVSLLLTFTRYANREETTWKQFQTKLEIKKLLKDMHDGTAENPNYIQPSLMFQNGLHDDHEIRNHFRRNSCKR